MSLAPTFFQKTERAHAAAPSSRQVRRFAAVAPRNTRLRASVRSKSNPLRGFDLALGTNLKALEPRSIKIFLETEEDFIWQKTFWCAMMPHS